MKQQLFKKLSLLFIGSILFSCSLEEEYVEKQQYQQTSKYSIERKSLQELLKNQKFSTAFSQLPKQDIKITGSIAGRTVMEQDYGFTISESIPAQVMSTEYLTSYTFHITRDIPAIDFFENLVIQTDTLGTTKAYVVKYSLHGVTDYFAEHDSYIVDGEKELTPIMYNANDAQAKIQYMGDDDCTIYTLMCPYGHPHPASLICIGEGQDVYWTYDSSNCGSGSGNTGDSGGGDGGTGNSGSDSSGGGNTGGTPGDEDYDDGLVDPKTCKGCGGVVTVPVPELEEEEILVNPCKKIKKLKEKIPSLTQALTDLSNTTNQDHENGIFADETVTNTSTNPIQNMPNISNQGGSIKPNLNPSNKYIMMAHTHDVSGSTGNGTYSIFSWGDLATINRLIVEGHIKTSEFIFYVITADGTRYALTIENSNKLSEVFYYIPENSTMGSFVDGEKMMKMDKIRQQYYDSKENINAITITSDKNKDKKTFLKFIKEADLGVQLFEVDSTFQNYTKLSLNNNDEINYENCN